MREVQVPSSRRVRRVRRDTLLLFERFNFIALRFSPTCAVLKGSVCYLAQ
jgi:hypothetical protein